MRSCGQRQDAEPEDLPAAAVLLEAASNPVTLEELARAIDTSVAYERLRIRVAEASSKQLPSVIEPQLVELTDQAWLLIRPTAVLARVASGQDVAVDAIDPVVLVPANLVGTALNVVPGEWLTHLKTARADDAWWNDRFMVRSGRAAIGSSRWMLLCPAGHCLHDSPSRVRRYPEKEFHCTVCAGSRPIEGITSLTDTDPALAEQWDLERNGDLTAGMVLRGSNAMVSWRCAEGHPWQATVANRALRGSRCPYCSAKGVLSGFNDLATTHPRLSAFWDPDVEQKQPHEVSAGNATVKIQLRCPAGHRFIRTPAKLVSRPFCPVCDGRTVAAGLNDLATTHPHVASWWHPSQNGPLKPSDVKAGSEKRVWWVCPDGHEFQQKIDYRTKQAQQQCPVDTGRLLLTGVNDLSAKHPDLISDWDDERNDVDPTQLVPGTKKRWWTCKDGHTQCTTVRNRVRSGGCSICSPEERVGTTARGFERGRQGWDKRLAMGS
ncbi:zinc-ribbon domain-containing protein [Kocuria sp. WRN011]|uniref:zinc-ribbon domain-containing protein n=1 Tax=Kocuria sp. WRN011 TaxID=2029858 RepID=UPI00130417C3|nr:zinc-ribbon domain-containing protein [Kocuria sp. WRN011]